jgi:hypothetical protein
MIVRKRRVIEENKEREREGEKERERDSHCVK